MKTTSFALALAILLAVGGRAVARLNETEDQCVKRYGPSVFFPTPVISPLRVRYHYFTWNIDTGFRQGVVSMIRYSKRSDITEREFRLILDAEGGLANWHNEGKRLFLGGDEWKRSDGTTAILYKTCALLTASDRVGNAAEYSTNYRSRDWEKGYPIF